MAAISTLVVSIAYLIPQMVGAGTLVTPLLGLPHYVGVILVGAIVITIVATAGMTSTTYVQFLKGSLLLIFSVVLVVATLVRGLSAAPDQGGRVPFPEYRTMAAVEANGILVPGDASYTLAEVKKSGNSSFAKLIKEGSASWWKVRPKEIPVNFAGAPTTIVW